MVITSARIWPGADYTRITFESAKPVNYKMTVLSNPDRLVLDLENVSLDASLKSLSDKIQDGDPYIKKVRAANFKPGVVRVVIDLKSEVKPKLSALKPAGDYKHHLMLDVYPLQDPLMALLEPREKPPAEPTVVTPAVTDSDQMASGETPVPVEAVKPAEACRKILPPKRRKSTA